MRRLFLIIVFIVVGDRVFSQLTIQPIIKQKETRGRISNASTVAPASLPFWDDFSISGSYPEGIRVWGSDSARQWNAELSKDVFINASLAINPPSYKVATFDGLDANGAFHGADKGLADQLVSDTINLQGKADVVLSFYWQAGGAVEIPEPGDSLVLQFYNPRDTLAPWQTVWMKDGEDLLSNQDSVFTQEAIELSSEFLNSTFLFRFQSYGDLDGPFDAWHVDYIYLDESRRNDDFYYDDISLVSQPSNPFTPFNSIPLNQLMNNLSAYSGTVSVVAAALEKPDLSNAGVPARYKIEFREILSSTFIDSVDFGDQPTIPVNQNPFISTSMLEVETGDYDLSLIPATDSILLETKIYIRNNIDSLFRESNIDQFNDTILSVYKLHNYYAYDDGIAEYAVGTNINGGQVSVEYWLELPDTLTHIDIYFPNIDPPSTNSALQLRVWRNLNDDPLRSQAISVINGSALNEFTRYKLNSPIVLSDTFYIGYQQSKNDYIGVGFDRSNPEGSSHIFENKSGQWEQNQRLRGALMIRPVFIKTDSLILSTPRHVESKIYPNPTNGILFVDGPYESITVRDFSGRTVVYEDRKHHHDFGSLKAGLYLLTIHRREGDQRLKIIKK